MSDKGVRRLLGEIIGDSSFAEKFFDNPEETTRKSGFDLSDKEVAGVIKLTPEDLAISIDEIEAGPGVEAGFEIDVKTAKF